RHLLLALGPAVLLCLARRHLLLALGPAILLDLSPRHLLLALGPTILLCLACRHLLLALVQALALDLSRRPTLLELLRLGLACGDLLALGHAALLSLSLARSTVLPDRGRGCRGGHHRAPRERPLRRGVHPGRALHLRPEEGDPVRRDLLLMPLVP